jgi:PAS domain S-box-containing protein
MKEKIKIYIRSSQTWQLTLFSILGAVLITDLITLLFSYWRWHVIEPTIILLGTLNAVLVPSIMLPLIIRSLKRTLQLEEQNQLQVEALSRLEAQRQAEAATQRRADEISLLYQLGIQLASGQNLYGTLLRLQTEISKLVQLDVLFVAIYDEQTDVVEFPIYFINGKPYQHTSRKLSDRRGLTGEVIYTKHPVYLPDMMSDPVVARFAPVGDPRVDLHTFLGVPLFVNEKVIGVLSVQSVHRDAYSRDQIQLIESVAVQAAVAIEKTGLLDQLKQELEERKRTERILQQSALRLEMMHNIDRALLSAQSLDEIKLGALTRIHALISCTRASITMFDFENDQASFLATTFGEVEQAVAADAFPLEEYGLYIIDELKQSKEYYVADVFTEPHATDLDKKLGAEGFRTWLYIPLLYQGRLIGGLNLARGVGQPFRAEDTTIAYDIANPLAIAIQQTRLTQTLQTELEERKQIETNLREREEILEAITFSAEQFLKVPDWRVNIDLVLERLGKTLNATHAYLFEDHVDAQGELVTSMRYEWTAEGYPSDLETPYYQNAKIHREGFEEQVAALMRGEARIGNTSTFNPIEKQIMASLGVKAILEVPISINGRIWGAVGFDDFEQEREWSNVEVDALKIAAGILSAAIQRQEAESAVHESERIYRQAIEAAGAVPYYRHHGRDKYLFMGKGIEKITGYLPEQMSPPFWASIVQEVQMVGDLAGLSETEAMLRVRNKEFSYWKCDYLIRAKDGQTKWVADSAVDLFDETGSSYGSIGIMQDVTERKNIEERLRQREAMLEAITFAAEQFLKTSDWRENINRVLERLGQTVNATHAYLFEHHRDEAERDVSSLTYEWTAPGFLSDLENPSFQNTHPVDEGVDSTDERLRRGEVFVGNTGSFPEVERERLNELGIKSLIEVPLFVEGWWCGTLGFDDMVNAHEWSPAEIDAFKVAAGILSAAIQRQEAEAAVRESERIYRQAIEAAGAVPYYRDHRANRYTFIGGEIEKIIGYKPEEVTVELLHEIIREDIPLGEGQGFSMDEAIHHSRQGEFKVWKSDMRVIAKNGDERWLADSAVELFEDGVASYASVGILQDVTDRKHTEANLRKREAILEAITFSAEQFLKSSNWRENIDLVLERLGKTINTTHAYLFENHMGPQGEALTSIRYEWTEPGYQPDLLNPRFKDMPLEEDGLEIWFETVRTGQPYIGDSKHIPAPEFEYLLQRGIKALVDVPIFVNGQWWGVIGFDDLKTEHQWSNIEVDVIRVAANVLSAAIKRQMDEEALQNELNARQRLIGELEIKNAESETLRESITSVAATLEISDAVNRILDQLARVVPYNSASVQLLKGNRLEIVSSRGLEFNNGDIGLQFTIDERDPAYSVIRGQSPYVLYQDVQVEHFSFTEFPHDQIHAWMAVPLKVKGQITGIIALDGYRVAQFSERDATLAVTYANQVAIALENARLFSELQTKFAERQTLIGELENKNSELERFTYTVSHDLKSPLVTISGFLGYLEQDALSGNTDRLKRDIFRIQEAVKKMQKLLSELLELSRIGRVINPAEQVSFHDLVREAITLVQGRLEAQHVTIQLQPNLPSVFVDKPRLVEAIQNLLDNAAKYMGEQPNPRIEIGQRRESTEPGQSVFYIKDNGIGIAPEFHERIFGLFNKLDPKSEGTGVGLALVRRIIEIHGGQIWVESEAGFGSTFLFTLPLSGTMPTQPKTDSGL